MGITWVFWLGWFVGNASLERLERLVGFQRFVGR
jgi:hypothetical protein